MRRHLRHQLPILRAVLGAALTAPFRSRPTDAQVPGPVVRRTVPARAPDLVRDYVCHCGGDPAAYGTDVPAHLFPQWGFPLLASTLRDVPYDLRRALNGGCRMEIARPLPGGEPLQLEACLESVDDDGRRAVLENRITTGTASAPAAVTAWMYAVVRLPGGRKGPKKDKPVVPATATPLAQMPVTPRHGRHFALLTGDFNPIHWLGPYARWAGFPSTILHGFATLAYALEALNRHRFDGDPTQLTAVDVRFTRPLVLPASPSLFVEDGSFFVGDAPGEEAYLTATFEESRHG